MHADFYNGWDTDVLQNAINTVYSQGATPETSVYQDLSSVDIPAFDLPSTDLAVLAGIAQSCEMEAAIVELGVAKPYNQTYIMTALPGCNLPWEFGPKPTC
jgi:hypothetical protein